MGRIMSKILVLFLFVLTYNQLYSQGYGGIVEPNRPINLPIIKYFQKNDTIFQCEINKKDSSLKSMSIYQECTIKKSKNKWITPFGSDSAYFIMKFKKVKSSKWFEENKSNLLNADFECKLKYEKAYYADGSMYKRVYFWGMLHTAKKKPCARRVAFYQKVQNNFNKILDKKNKTL